MKISSFKLLSVVMAIIAIGVLSFSITPGQLDDAAGFAISAPVACQTSGVNSFDSCQNSDSVSSDEQEAIKSLLSVARKSKMSILDALEDVFGQAKDKAGEVADAVTGVKDEAERRLSEWQEEREQAAREREQAKARAMKVLENAKLTKKRKTLECSAKKAQPLKLVECSDPKVKVSADGKLDRSKPGTTTAVYTLSLDGQSVKREVKFKVRDTKSPKISFVEKAPKIEVGDVYRPAKNVKLVKDAVSGELDRVKSAPKAKGKKVGVELFYDEGWYTVKGDVDTSTAGVYPIEVDASDAYGNTAHRSFNVTVVMPEPQPEPEIAEAPMLTKSMAKGQADEEEARQAWLREEVYITPTGKCYHTSYCSAKGSSSWPVSRQEARDLGLHDCSKCIPDRAHPGW